MFSDLPAVDTHNVRQVDGDGLTRGRNSGKLSLVSSLKCFAGDDLIPFGAPGRKQQPANQERRFSTR